MAFYPEADPLGLPSTDQDERKPESGNATESAFPAGSLKVEERL